MFKLIKSFYFVKLFYIYRDSLVRLYMHVCIPVLVVIIPIKYDQ